MPKLTNKCVLCGKPIVKAETLCASCKMKQKAAEDEVHVSRVRLIPELLWEKRRYEIATAAMQGMLASPVDSQMQSNDEEYIAKKAVRHANALIAELKKGGSND